MSKRRLVAIMFTDIEGYTALMQKSEGEALLWRETHRKIFDSNTEKFNGEIIQYYGDGTLSIFESAVDAVLCGIEIQRALQEDSKVPLRIGIHLGDIIISKEDIIGNGVNVASRVESLAVAGSVLISDKVYDEVRNYTAIQTQFLKEFKLKNVEQPVGIYAVSNPGLVVPDANTITGKLAEEKSFLKTAKKLIGPLLAIVFLMALIGFWVGSQWGDIFPQRPNVKVAVLPLENAGFDEAEDYMPVGMTEELAEELSKVDGLTILGRSAAKVLAASAEPSNSLISNEMAGVDYFVGGSVKLEDQQLAVEITLKKSMDDESPWKNSYTEDISNVKDLWSKVAIDVSKRMGIKASAVEMLKRAYIKPIDPETYSLYLLGRQYLNKQTREDTQKGIDYLNEALDKNPADANAWAHLAEAYIFIGHNTEGSLDVFPKALSAAKRAIVLDSTVAMGWAALAHYHTYFGRDWEMAEYAFERANELNPNLAYNHYHRAWYLVLFGRMTEAIIEHKKAQELEPFEPDHTAWLAELYRMVGLYDEALAELGKVMQMAKGHKLAERLKGQVYVDQGKIEEGLKILQQTDKYFRYAAATAKLGRVEEARSLIEELESTPPNAGRAMTLATIYSYLGDQDKVFEWLSYEQKVYFFPWIRVWLIADETRKDPRFLEIMKDLNLPPPAPLEFDPEALIHL